MGIWPCLQEKLLDGLQHALILENQDRDLLLLVAASKPELASLSAFETSLVLDKGNKEWMSSMITGVRHYVYPVHLSQASARYPLAHRETVSSASHPSGT
jgi:hypothetical protein